MSSSTLRFPRDKSASANASSQGKAKSAQGFKNLLDDYIFFMMHSDSNLLLWAYFEEIFN